jgi:hypothetical protein
MSSLQDETTQENYLITPLGKEATVMHSESGALIREAEKFVADRAVLPDNRFLLPLMMWAAHTYCWKPCQFVLPYLGFVGESGSGKNRAMALVGSLCNNFCMPTVTTPAALRNDIHNEEPTLGVEECEKELLTHNTPLHKIFNGGYMPGAHWDKTGPGGETVRLSIYCPKMYTSIGDPDVSLRSRCIIVPMTTGKPTMDEEPQVFMATGALIGERLHALVEEHAETIAEVYRRPNHFSVPEMQVGRDFQIWKPLWSICQVLLPERLNELQRVSTYITSLKSRPRRTVADMQQRKDNSDLLKNCNWLLMDADTAVRDYQAKNIRTSVLVQQVLELRDGWWEGYQYEDTKGVGIGIGDRHGDGVFSKMLQLATEGKVKPAVRYMESKKSAHGYSVAEIKEAAEAFKLRMRG